MSVFVIVQYCVFLSSQSEPCGFTCVESWGLKSVVHALFHCGLSLTHTKLQQHCPNVCACVCVCTYKTLNLLIFPKHNDANRILDGNRAE